MASLPVDDKDLDDAALWAVIDSAAAASYSTSPTTTTTNHRYRKLLSIKNSTFRSPPQQQQFLSPPPPSSHHRKSPRQFTSPVYDANSLRPQKIFRPASSCISDCAGETNSPDALLVKSGPIVPTVNYSPHPVKELSAPYAEKEYVEWRRVEEKEKDRFTHCLAGRFPTVSLFKDYQDAAMAILDKSDYTMISGNPFIKKTGWRKIAFYFNVSFEIKDKTIEFDDNRNVQRAEFVVRAFMQGGRFSDGWGSCERREKKFLKPNNDIPSTAETRAKNRACQDLIGIGQYRPGAARNHSPSPR